MRRYFFVGLFIVAAFFAVLMLWPFAKTIIVSIALSTIFYPLYLWIYKKIGNIDWLAAILTIIIFIIILCIPLVFIGSTVIEQSQSLYSWVVDRGGLNWITTMINEKITSFAPNISINAQEHITQAIGGVVGSVGTMFTATLSSILSFFLVLLSMFYFLKDGDRWKESLKKLSPLSNEADQKIFTKLKQSVNGIVKGYLVIAVVQGLLMGLGLYIFGVPHPALWGVMAAIASLVPTIGTALVAAPAVLFLFLVNQDGQAIGLALWSAVIVGTVDNVLNPLIVGKSIQIHPLLILFTVLGGLALMGPVGILIGPLLISFIYALISVYKSEMA
jgi:predicted PurR-regulated permease PerM